MRILHLHTRFEAGAEALRAARLLAAYGPEVSHTFAAAQPVPASAKAAVAIAGTAGFDEGFPRLAGAATPARLQRIAAAMRGHDLVLTHGWGAAPAAMAYTLFRDVLSLPPLVHHEYRLEPVEAERPLRRRDWYRRIALGRTAALVVPSPRLEALALAAWQQPRARVRLVPPGADLAALAGKPRRDVLPRLIKRRGEKWLGAIAPADAGDELIALVAAFDRLAEAWHLVLLGEGAQHEPVRAEALRRGIAHRVHSFGPVSDPLAALGLFDLFAFAAPVEPEPGLVAAVLAAGIALVGRAAGDLAAMLPAENRALLVPPRDDAGFAHVLVALADDDPQRRAAAAANRARAVITCDGAAEINALRAIYAGAMGHAAMP